MNKAILKNCSNETIKALEDIDLDTLEQIVNTCPNVDIMLADSLTLIRCRMTTKGNLIIEQISSDEVLIS